MSKPVPITLDDIVSRTSDLPTFSASALEVMRQADSATARAESLAEIISQDQSLSARVLRLANSAYYGLERKITNLPEGVVVLGTRTIKNLAMVAATYPWMSRPLRGYGLEPKQLWHHSFGTALGSQLIAKMSGKCDDQTAFTSGLLHDIGKVALCVWIDEKLRAIVYYAEREGITFDEAERKILGYDHCEVGERLAENWNLPEDVMLAIRYHHSPSDCPTHNPLVDCVHIGGYVTMSMGFGLGGDGLHYRLDSGCFDRLQIKLEDLDEITDNFVLMYEKYESMFLELAA
ncbi:MAG TPA: HDOD domain-containing protein [Fimbriimonadaceae bacterium]|nr:HDOD domain-containing protein [Fimbriimonadaceae bacterium]